MTNEELIRRSEEAIRIDNEIIKDAPIAGYDTEQRRAYLEYSDGRREYID